MCLINVSSSCLYSSEFLLFARLMIKTKVHSLLTAIFRTNGPTIANINNIQVIIKCHYQIGAASGFTVLHFLCCLELIVCSVDIHLVCMGRALVNCLRDIVRKFRLHDYVVV